MCVKLLPRDLNPDPYPPHSTNTYTCKVTTALILVCLIGCYEFVLNFLLLNGLNLCQHNLFNIKWVEMGCVISYQSNMTHLLSLSSGLYRVNPLH